MLFVSLHIPFIPLATFSYVLVVDNILVDVTIPVVNTTPAVDSILLVADMKTTAHGLHITDELFSGQ